VSRNGISVHGFPCYQGNHQGSGVYFSTSSPRFFLKPYGSVHHHPTTGNPDQGITGNEAALNK